MQIHVANTKKISLWSVVKNLHFDYKAASALLRGNMVQ